MSAAGRFPTDLHYTCFINQPEISKAIFSEQEDYVMSTMLWDDEINRNLINLTFDDGQNLVEVIYKEYKKSDIPQKRYDALFCQGEKRAKERLERYKQNHKKKLVEMMIAHVESERNTKNAVDANKVVICP